jgi:hypothetical protein
MYRNDECVKIGKDTPVDYFKANYLQLRGGLKENHGILVILLRYKPCNAGRHVFRFNAIVTCLVLKAEVVK